MIRTSLPQMPANSYRHANDPIFLFLIVGGEGVLVHDDNRGVRCAACPRKLWEHLFDSSNEVGFLLRKFSRVPARHNRHLNSARDIPLSSKTQKRRSCGRVPPIQPVELVSVLIPLQGSAYAVRRISEIALASKGSQ